jgi:hypothetical protein
MSVIHCKRLDSDLVYRLWSVVADGYVSEDMTEDAILKSVSPRPVTRRELPTLLLRRAQPGAGARQRSCWVLNQRHAVFF